MIELNHKQIKDLEFICVVFGKTRPIEVEAVRMRGYGQGRRVYAYIGTGKDLRGWHLPKRALMKELKTP